MSGNQPQTTEKKKEEDTSVPAFLEQITRELKNVRETVEGIKANQKLPEEETPEFDPLHPPVMDFANADTRAVFETAQSSLTRVQKDFAEGQSRLVSQESFQRGLEEVPVDVQSRASRLELAWWQSDQQFGHLLASKHGGVGMWLSKHFRLLIIGVVIAVLGSIALVRFTDPQVLDTIGAAWDSMDSLHQFLYIAMVFAVLLVIALFFWWRGRSKRPETIGTVAQ